MGISSRPSVAAFTGGVDGNKAVLDSGTSLLVAAFTGGVDGNAQRFEQYFDHCASPPSRAAWIEILYFLMPPSSAPVAAFTGGVDGNVTDDDRAYATALSPPSRAAWIEIRTNVFAVYA